MSAALEQQLWQDVQRAYAKSRDYRAGNNPEYAEALAAWERVALSDERSSNVLPFQPRGAK